jgi:hypothetical protein
LIASFVLVTCVAGLGSARCAERTRADEDGWITLFDGETLAGWHTNPERIGHGTGGRWQVEDGVITGEQDPPGSGNGGILLTDRKFGDFDLVLEMKPDWGCDSGVFVRSNDRGQCIQMMVDYHDRGDVGHIYGEGTGGFNNRVYDVYGVYDDEKNLVGLKTEPTTRGVPEDFSISGEDWIKLWKLDDWNTAKIRVVGNPPVVTTWINGQKVSHFDGNTYDGEGYDKAHVSQTLGPEGHIAVQVHGGKSWPKGAKVRWRNIKVKPL